MKNLGYVISYHTQIATKLSNYYVFCFKVSEAAAMPWKSVTCFPPTPQTGKEWVTTLRTFFLLLFQVMCFTSLLPINSPTRRLKKSVKTKTLGWRRWGSSRRLGGMALTSATTGGWGTPVFATLWLWPGPSVEVVYLGWEPCIDLRTRQASLPLIADLMPTALNVSVWYLLNVTD